MIGPIFPPINPTNAYSSGFQTPNAQGDVGSIAGLTVVMSAGLAAGTILVYSTAAAKTFEYVYGNLQVVEPSVWGVQVGYAGDFDAVVIEPPAVVKVTKDTVTEFDDPNREAVGVDPIWTETDDSTPKATGATAGTPGTWTPAGSDAPVDPTDMAGVTATPATPWASGEYVQTELAGALGQVSWSGSDWVAGPAATREGTR